MIDTNDRTLAAALGWAMEAQSLPIPEDRVVGCYYVPRIRQTRRSIDLGRFFAFPNEMQILVLNSLSDEETFRTLLHEARHLWQYQMGHLSWSAGQQYWLGAPDADYERSGAERDANEWAGLMLAPLLDHLRSNGLL